jgi:hypothetical protein
MKRYVSLGLTTVATSLLMAIAVSACSSSGDDDDTFGGSSGSTSTTSGGAMSTFGGASAGGATSTNHGGASSTTGGSGSITGGTGSTTGGVSNANACNGVAYTGGTDPMKGCAIEAEQEAVGIPVDMYIMMDRSSSMLNTVPNTNITRWDAFLAGMQDFVTQSSMKDLRAGINFFGASQFGGDDTVDCNISNYATPKVEIAQVSENGAALIEAMNANQPAGLTPTYPALKGAVQHAKDWIAAGSNKGRAVVVVFVTDGYPTQCDPLTIAEISAVAKDAFDTSHIRTFVIGLAAAFNLDAIALAGGTKSATLLDEGEPTSSLVDALSNITETNVACEYEVPTPPAMTEIDVNRVQLIFTPQSGAKQEIPRIENAGACAINPNGGWYYDNPTNPKRIYVCPCTCSRINTAGSLRVSIGCEPTPGIG